MEKKEGYSVKRYEYLTLIYYTTPLAGSAVDVARKLTGDLKILGPQGWLLTDVVDGYIAVLARELPEDGRLLPQIDSNRLRGDLLEG